jgi:hypothetical protein
MLLHQYYLYTATTTQFPVTQMPNNDFNTTLNSMSFLDKMKKASKSVVDAGAKQMLKVRETSELFFFW